MHELVVATVQIMGKKYQAIIRFEDFRKQPCLSHDELLAVSTLIAWIAVIWSVNHLDCLCKGCFETY